MTEYEAVQFRLNQEKYNLYNLMLCHNFEDFKKRFPNHFNQRSLLDYSSPEEEETTWPYFKCLMVDGIKSSIAAYQKQLDSLSKVHKVIGQRESIHKYFMDIAYKVAERSTCIKRKVGSVLVKNKKIVATGYNNPSTGLPNCTKETCVLDKFGKCALACHSEVSCLLQATPEERSGATMYVTTQPCSKCQLALLNSGIKYVIYDEAHKPEFNFFQNTHIIEMSLTEVLKTNQNWF